MSTIVALDRFWQRADVVFFKQHKDRMFHIRKAWDGECAGEFWKIGEHDRKRRRVVLCRVDATMNLLPDGKIMKIPFLAFADEEIADNDDTLFPIVRDIMLDALKATKAKA